MLINFLLENYGGDQQQFEREIIAWQNTFSGFFLDLLQLLGHSVWLIKYNSLGTTALACQVLDSLNQTVFSALDGC